MKQDMQSGNVNMHDLIAYRIEFTPHPRAGDTWCIYPTYDFAHCIVDSLEDITHSLCTEEFGARRASYYWLLHALDLYQPYMSAYNQLNVNLTVTSERLSFLVRHGLVEGWDDPRLMTLAGLKRRGVTATGINSFVRGIGITTSKVSWDVLGYHLREEFRYTAPLAMVVLRPLKVVITNMEACSIIDLDAVRWPYAQTEDSLYKVPFSNVVYIEQSDFRMVDSKDFSGLALGKSVLLRYAFPIMCTGAVMGDDKKTVTEIRAVYDESKEMITEGRIIPWVAGSSPGVDPLKVEVRLFQSLFKSKNPNELYDWPGDLNFESKIVISGAYAVSPLKNAVIGETFQFERLGYFTVDKDSLPGKPIFNRIVSLQGRIRQSWDPPGKPIWKR